MLNIFISTGPSLPHGGLFANDKAWVKLAPLLAKTNRPDSREEIRPVAVGERARRSRSTGAYLPAMAACAAARRAIGTRYGEQLT